MPDDAAALERLRVDAAWLPLDDKELVVATGADRVRFLHGILTGDVAGTAVGAGCHATLLTPKAHVIAEMRIFVRADDLYLVVPAGQGAGTVEALERYAIMDDFKGAWREDFALLAVLGPRAAEHLASAGSPPGELGTRATWSHADVAPTGAAGAAAGAAPVWIARARSLGTDGFWVGGARAVVGALGDALSAAGVARLSPALADVARIAAREPAWGHEITDEYFPMEVGLDDAIDYRKGCFLGQEPIVRIRDRGHVNWRLAGLALGPGALPAPGDRLESDAKPKAGRITSVGRLPDGNGIALALVHVSVPAGAELRALTAAGPGHAVVVG